MAKKSANPVLPNAREKQVWTAQSWQERALLSAMSLQPRGPVAEMKLISKDKLLLKTSLSMDILLSRHAVIMIHLFLEWIIKEVNKGWR